MISDARGSHVSPGIYTEERDVAYSVKSLGITSLGLVGETLYGPAFQNIEIENWGEFVDYFGGTSTDKFKNGLPKYELPYVAKEYLKKSKRLNVVRVLGLSGYDAGPAWVINATRTVENGKTETYPVIILRSKMEYGNSEDNQDPCNQSKDVAKPVVKNISISQYNDVVSLNGCNSGGLPTNVNIAKFKLSVTKVDDNVETFNVTLNPGDSNYIYKVLGNRPNSNSSVYVEAVYEHILEMENFDKTSVTINVVEEVAKLDDDTMHNYKSQFRYAMTPWFVSEATIRSIDNNSKEGSVRKLFRFATISDGEAANYQVKVSIQNIKPTEGTFDVIVRDFNDTDANPVILERFTKCNLVAGDTDYLAYRIGTIDDGYKSNSKYIAVEMADGEDFSDSVPAGFLGYPMPNYDCKFNGSFPIPYNIEYNPTKKAKKQYFGTTALDVDVLSFKGCEFYEDLALYTTKGFHLDSRLSDVNSILVDGVEGYEFTTVSSTNVMGEMYQPVITSDMSVLNGTIYKDINVRKFTVCFYGGFDGWDINRNERTYGNEYKATNYKVVSGVSAYSNISNELLPATANTSDYYAYLGACRVFANPQDIDINLFATPGINWVDQHLLSQEILDMIEDNDGGRGGDALYVMESPNGTDAEELADLVSSNEISSSYACTYFPWVMYYDESNKKYINLPVTKDVVRNMADTDNTSYPWFAPAGMQRGNVDCIKAVFKTSLADEDALYAANINPVKSYAQDGVRIWGNKTMYDIESPVNRVNVRRLMIRIKKLVTEAAKNLIFEQYDETLEKQFLGLVNPILADVKANRGIIDYRVVTECTPETRDQHILPAKIMIKPTQALEYISISFVVYPESVSFDE